MQIKLFTIPISDTGTSNEELNRFLRANKVLEVENHLISNERGAFWCFCVKYIESQWQNQSIERTKIDYKEELDEATFKVFSKLREIRKQIEAEEAIPAYAVCTDQELAAMARLKNLTPEGMLTVKGFGEKKLEKYGLRIIQRYQQNTPDETSG